VLLFAGVSGKQRFQCLVFAHRQSHQSCCWRSRAFCLYQLVTVTASPGIVVNMLDARARLSRLPQKPHTDSASPTAPQPFWLGLLFVRLGTFLGQANCLFERQTENSHGIWKRRAIVVIGYPPPNHYLACSFYASLTANDSARESY
jgi:hypothetical protein